MRKVIRLNERDLSRIVKRVLREDDHMVERMKTVTVSELMDEPYTGEGGTFKVMTDGIKLEFNTGSVSGELFLLEE